jgi:hypothetical protein
MISAIILSVLAISLIGLALWKGSKDAGPVFMSGDEWKGKQASFYWDKKR